MGGEDLYRKYVLDKSAHMVFSSYGLGFSFDDHVVVDAVFEKILNISFELFFCLDDDEVYAAYCKNVDIYPAKLLSSFSNYNVWFPRAIFKVTDRIIISLPRLKSENTVSFLNIDSATVTYLILSVIMISSLFSLSYSIRNSSRKFKRKKLTQYFFNIMCDLLALFLYEPLRSLSTRFINSSEKLLLASWLLALTILSSVISCNLKSDFCDESYIFYDKVEDIIQHKVKLLFSENDKQFFNNFVARNAWMSRHKIESEFVLVSDAAETMLSSTDLQVFIATENTVRANIYFNPAMVESGYNYHMTKIKSEYVVYGVNKSLIQDHKFDEHLTLGFLVLFETKPLQYLKLVTNIFAERVLWKTPIKIISAMRFFNLKVIFQGYFYAMLLSTVVLIFELIIKF